MNYFRALQVASINKNLIEEIMDNPNDYQIIRRFKKVDYYNQLDDLDSGRKLIGIFVDIETTGGDAIKDKITELALVPFEYNEDGKIYRILNSHVEFQDPGIDIPEPIVKLTGITNEMVAGKSLSLNKINELISSASIIIAHHAAFDRKFLTKISPIFKEKLWGCTVAHIDWRKEDIASSKLEYLAYKFGVFYDAHRAEIDSLIGIHILAQQLPVSKALALSNLLKNAVGAKYCKIWAENSPFDKKDILKRHRYRWNDGSNDLPKSWYKIVNEKTKEEELKFLFENIYDRNLELKIEHTNFFGEDE